MVPYPALSFLAAPTITRYTNAKGAARIRFVSQHVRQGGEQLLHRERLAQRAVGAQHLRRLQGIEVAAHAAGYGDDPHPGGDAAQLADRFKAVPQRHVDIHHHGIGGAAAQAVDAGNAVARFGNDVADVAQDPAHRRAHRRFVIDDEDTRRCGALDHAMLTLDHEVDSRGRRAPRAAGSRDISREIGH